MMTIAYHTIQATPFTRRPLRDTDTAEHGRENNPAKEKGDTDYLVEWFTRTELEYTAVRLTLTQLTWHGGRHADTDMPDMADTADTDTADTDEIWT